MFHSRLRLQFIVSAMIILEKSNTASLSLLTADTLKALIFTAPVKENRGAGTATGCPIDGTGRQT
jgi:hypothetical protein